MIPPRFCGDYRGGVAVGGGVAAGGAAAGGKSDFAGALAPAGCAGLKSVHFTTRRTGMSPSFICRVSSERMYVGNQYLPSTFSR